MAESKLVMVQLALICLCLTASAISAFLIAEFAARNERAMGGSSRDIRTVRKYAGRSTMLCGVILTGLLLTISQMLVV